MSIQTASDANFINIISSNDKVIVKFHADWCGSCKLIAPKYRRMSDDPRFSSIVFLDVNSEDNPITRKLSGVDNLPFFATFRSGQIVDHTATAKEETVVAMLERL